MFASVVEADLPQELEALGLDPEEWAVEAIVTDLQAWWGEVPVGTAWVLLQRAGQYMELVIPYPKGPVSARSLTEREAEEWLAEMGLLEGDGWEDY